MDETQLHAVPRVGAAIAAVKDGVAGQYRALASALPGPAAHAHWKESHGALAIVGHAALIRLSEEVGNLLAYARDAIVDPEHIAKVVNDAGAAIVSYMNDLAASAADRPARLLPAYRAVLSARGIHEVPSSEMFSSGSEATAAVEQAPAIPESVASELKRLNEAWCGWAEGRTQSDALHSTIDAVERVIRMLGTGAPADLLGDVGLAMRAQASVGKPDPEAAVEISSALLMLEDLIEDAPRATASFARRAANARARLQACLNDRAALQSLPPMELLDAQARQDEARVVLLAEAETVIRLAEAVLKLFFADTQKRSALAPLDKPLAQCAGMFAMLQDSSAAAAVSVCREEIGRLAAGPYEDAAIKDRLSSRLSALAEYVSLSRQGEVEFDAVLARSGLIPSSAPPENTEPAAKTAEVAVAADSGEALDQDMLEVFLEEAVEVLAAVENTLPASRQDPHNAELLTDLRRAFHTLKGSGRMVGLTELGEAAWEIEQVFNKLAQDRLSGTPDLYRLVALAHESFARWIAELRERGHSIVNAATLTEWARRVRSGEPLPAGSGIADERAPTTLTGGLETQPITIGETRVSAVLYSIFIEEARQHIQALQSHGGRIANEPAVMADPELLRAAHTLCSIAGTVGFDALTDLASALERVLLKARKTGSLEVNERSLVARAIESLGHMVARLADRQPPSGESALVEQLNRAATITPADAAASRLATTTSIPRVATQTARMPPPDERRVTRLDDDIDADLLAVFLAEAQELLPQVGQDLRDWRARPEDKLVPQSLQRLLHTLKGSARMAGAMAVGELTHQMETRVENASRLPAIPESLYDGLDASFDRLNELVDDLQQLDSESVSGGQNLSTTLTGDLQPVTTSTGPIAVTATTQPTMPGVPGSAPVTATTDPTLPAAAAREAAARRAVLRVRAESAERLANQAGEVAIARARAESELRSARTVMRELTDNISRLRAQLREIELQAEMQMQSRIAQAEETDIHFDPLEFDRFTRLQELTRLMAESVNDLVTVQQNLMRNLDEGEAALGAQARTTRELQDDLVRIRMSPFSSLSDRLYRVARVASRDVGKRVQLDIRGAHAELDRGVLDRIVAPLEHLLRNSIAHGIEPQEQRARAGKPETGEIVIEVRQEGNEVVLGIADDGAGLDLARIRAQAIAKGLMREDEALSDAQIADFIFRSGFSTASSVSEIAGRGVGLDVVRNEIASLGGRIEMSFERGKGTRFTIYLSLTLAVMKAVVIRVGEELYAIPSLLVEQLQSLKADGLLAAYGAREIVWRNTQYPLYYLAHLLGRTQAAPTQQRYNPVMLLRSGPYRVAVHVDQLLGGQEVVVKNIGPQLARISGVTGAAVLSGGETVLILNPVQLTGRAEQQPVRFAEAEPDVPTAAMQAPEPIAEPTPLEPVPANSAPPAARPATVLVVDDSLTVRKITSRTLAREGYNVVVAKDGIDALEKMQASAPDVIVTDIEMPRMDGFDLTRNVRADPRLKDLPVIMITSRTADKHRQHAAELGVTVFLGKPYEERELLQNIAGVARAAA